MGKVTQQALSEITGTKASDRGVMVVAVAVTVVVVAVVVVGI